MHTIKLPSKTFRESKRNGLTHYRIIGSQKRGLSLGISDMNRDAVRAMHENHSCTKHILTPLFAYTYNGKFVVLIVFVYITMCAQI